MHKQNPRSTYMRSLVINSGSGSSSVTTLSAKKNIEIKGYCSSLEGYITGNLNSSYRLMNVRNAFFTYGLSNDADFTGSDLTGASFSGNGCLNLTGAILTGTNFYGNTKRFCNVSTPVNSYITFTKDRTTTCITPLGENESILINRFVPLENPDYYLNRGEISYFNPLDLYKAIINPRYLFTNSKGLITLTSGEFISGNFETSGLIPSTFTSDDFKKSIKLDDTKKNLIIDKPLNNYVIFDFKFKITIKQEATDQFREGTTSVILEFTRNSQNQNIFPKPRCSVNDNYGDCIDYLG